MKVLVTPLVPFRKEKLVATLAFVEGSGTVDHLPPDPCLGNLQVVCDFDVCFLREPGDVNVVTMGTPIASNLDYPVWTV